MDARELDTNRLSLRLPTLDDFEDSAAMWSDQAIVRYIGGRPFTREESWLRLLRHVGHWQLLGFGFWIVRERTGGGFVGEVGLGDFRREMTPSFRGDPEIGWVLAQDTHGKGYATEAAQAALEWMRLRHRAQRTVCMIEPENPASLRVAAKCGFREFARTTYKNSAVVLLERNFGQAPTAERPS
jgi:RimJ/RimL family protein N-acetyltransferase